MTTDDIIKHYGGMREAMTELAPHGIYRQMFYAWEKNGVPQGRQYQLHVLTGGKLKVDAKYIGNVQGEPPREVGSTAELGVAMKVGAGGTAITRRTK